MKGLRGAIQQAAQQCRTQGVIEPWEFEDLRSLAEKEAILAFLRKRLDQAQGMSRSAPHARLFYTLIGQVLIDCAKLGIINLGEGSLWEPIVDMATSLQAKIRIGRLLQDSPTPEGFFSALGEDPEGVAKQLSGEDLWELIPADQVLQTLLAHLGAVY